MGRGGLGPPVLFSDAREPGEFPDGFCSGDFTSPYLVRKREWPHKPAATVTAGAFSPGIRSEGPRVRYTWRRKESIRWREIA